MTNPDPWRPPRLAGQTHDDDDLPDELRAIAARFAAQPTPHPTAADTARLVARLLAEEPGVAMAAVRAPRGRLGWTLRVARWRVRLLGPRFWLASVLLLALGAVVTPFLQGSDRALPLIVLAPLTAVLGLAHATRTSSRGLRAVEASCPLGLVEVTTGLVLAIVAFDCALGLVVTGGLALLHWAPFVALLAAWLGPLLLLAGLSLPIALRWGTLPAALIGGGPWLLLAVVARLRPDGVAAHAFFGLPQDGAALSLRLAAATLGGALLLLVYLRGGAWAVLEPA